MCFGLTLIHEFPINLCGWPIRESHHSSVKKRNKKEQSHVTEPAVGSVLKSSHLALAC